MRHEGNIGSRRALLMHAYAQSGRFHFGTMRVCELVCRAHSTASKIDFGSVPVEIPSNRHAKSVSHFVCRIFLGKIFKWKRSTTRSLIRRKKIRFQDLLDSNSENLQNLTKIFRSQQFAKKRKQLKVKGETEKKPDHTIKFEIELHRLFWKANSLIFSRLFQNHFSCVSLLRKRRDHCFRVYAPKNSV